MILEKNILNRQIVQTADGSSSLFLPDLNEHYHSVHGAMQESAHVFIAEGLARKADELQNVAVLEVGLGTGLNCLLTFAFARKKGIGIHYTAIEPYPLTAEEYARINHPRMVVFDGIDDLFHMIHTGYFGIDLHFGESFVLNKVKSRVEDVVLADNSFDLVYFDAFGPQVQPGCWQQEIFEKIGRSMKRGGMLVTYSARGSVKRALKGAGFVLEHPPGPPGKREMTRAAW